LHPQTGQTWSKEPNINIEENREKNTVNGVVKGGEKSSLHKLPDLGDPPEKSAYIAKHVILQALGDEKSSRFYELTGCEF
jgi:hypothetical protein